MGIRRAITLYRTLFEASAIEPDLVAEMVALLISLFMVTGIAWIAPLFFNSKRAEAIRRVSEERFRRLAEATWDLCLVHDLKGRIVDSNAAAQVALGYSAEELRQLSMPDVELDWRRERIAEYVKQGAGDPRALRRTHRRKDGSRLVSLVRGGLFGGYDEQLVLTVLHPQPDVVPSADDAESSL